MINIILLFNSLNNTNMQTQINSKKLVQYLNSNLSLSLAVLSHKDRTTNEIIDDFIDYLGINDGDTIEIKGNDWQDFQNDKRQDLMYERANNQADIYHDDLYKNVKLFADWTGEAMTEYGPFESFESLLVFGQCRAYEELGNKILKTITEYLATVGS